MKYSIIVPIYNVESFLGECIDSVLKQNYKDFEIILVDDGSTDHSGIICDAYKERFDCIKVIHKKNEGLSIARNMGVKVADGDYIIFLDSDDYWIDDNCLSIVDKAIKRTKCDILTWNFCKYYQALRRYDRSCKQTGNIRLINPDKDILNHYEFRACAWDKAIKKSIYEKNHYSFQKGVLSEDVEWSFELLKDIKSIAFLDYQINVYRQRSGSITKTHRERNTKDMIDHIQKLLKSVEMIEKGLLKNNCYAYISEQYVNCVIFGGKSQTIKRNKDFFENSRYLLKYGKTKKIFIIKCLLRFLGFQFTCLLCGLAFDMKNRFVT